MLGNCLAEVMCSGNYRILAESFAAQLLAGFHVRRLLPFAELSVERIILEPMALSPFPFPARTGKFPAGSALVQQAGVTPANRFRSIIHTISIAPAGW